MVRKSPQESATKFRIGTRKRGNDGSLWTITSTKNGTRRWTKTRKRIQPETTITTQIGNYRGMWKPTPPKPIHQMSRDELIRNLRKFRDAWEKITTRNSDLGDERLANETTDGLRNLISFYYGDGGAKETAEPWLREL